MRFHLIDQIVDLVPGKRIHAVKNLTLAEEYLADHFPAFPVMPGVLMLEALVQAAAWLWRLTEDYAHSIIVLRETRGVKYGNFVEPGKRLQLKVEMLDESAQTAAELSFRGNGEVDGVSTVSARLTLAAYNLRDSDESLKGVDESLIADYRSLYKVLCHKEIHATAGLG